MAVYFVKESKRGLIKIGTSCNPEKRIISLPSQWGGEIGEVELLKTIEGSYEEEKFYQNLLKESRFDPYFSHEWFLPSPEVMFFVNKPVEWLNKLSQEYRDLRSKYLHKVSFRFDGKNVVAKAQRCN